MDRSELSSMGHHDQLYWVLVHAAVTDLPKIVASNKEAGSIINEQKFWIDVYTTHQIPVPVTTSTSFRENYVYYRTWYYIHKLMNGEPLLYYLAATDLEAIFQIQNDHNLSLLHEMMSMEAADSLYILKKFEETYALYIISGEYRSELKNYKFLELFELISLLVVAKIRIYAPDNAKILDESFDNNYIYGAIITADERQYFTESSKKYIYRDILSQSDNLLMVDELENVYTVKALNLKHIGLTNISSYAGPNFSGDEFIKLAHQSGIRLLKILKADNKISAATINDLNVIYPLPSSI